MADERAVWLYCVAAAGAPLPEGLPGVHAPDPVRRTEHAGLAALVSEVPLSEYGEEPLRRNLNDLAWLERVARSHAVVLETALEGTTIVPVRLCTIFDDDEGARRMLADEHAALAGALDTLAGRTEWSVKVVVDRAALRQAAGGSDPGAADASAVGSGTAYLLRRRQERELRELADGIARDVADDVHANVGALAQAAVRNAPQNRELSHHEGDMLLNGSYLVETADLERLRALVAELQDRHGTTGARVELTGPFPPYNFVAQPAGA